MQVVNEALSSEATRVRTFVPALMWCLKRFVVNLHICFIYSPLTIEIYSNTSVNTGAVHFTIFTI